MKQNSLNSGFVMGLFLFFIFTGAMFMVLVFGAGAYNDIRNELESQYNERTCVSYICAKLRHYDSEGAVSIGENKGIETIMLAEEENGAEYITYIYYYEGYMRELYCEKSVEFDPDAGFSVIPAEGLSVKMAGDALIKIECKSGGRTAKAYVALYSEKEAFA
ncbi:MAG: DUF4860 domain-containing protein [Lachnospiraceae bacterium]|nr:DUF4860 domain-containing protein [Lachnospiraceae bacterium]